MSSEQDILQQKFKKKEEIVSREIAGETILVPIKGKLADMQRIFALENVSEYIWQQLDGEKKVKRYSYKCDRFVWYRSGRGGGRYFGVY